MCSRVHDVLLVELVNASAAPLLQHPDLDVAIFHLAAITFEADWAGHRHLERRFQYFAIAGTQGRVPFDRDHNFVPVLGPVAFEFFVGSGD